MGLFDKILGGSSASETLTKEEGFVAVLLCTLASDGNVADEELQALFTICGRTKLLGGQSPDRWKSMFKKIMGQLQKHGLAKVLADACQVLPKELRETAFALAVDMVFADGSVEAGERKLIELLQKELQISDVLALKVVEVIELKNRG